MNQNSNSSLDKSQYMSQSMDIKDGGRPNSFIEVPYPQGNASIPQFQDQTYGDIDFDESNLDEVVDKDFEEQRAYKESKYQADSIYIHKKKDNPDVRKFETY